MTSSLLGCWFLITGNMLTQLPRSGVFMGQLSSSKQCQRSFRGKVMVTSRWQSCQSEHAWHLQAWADNLLLTARKVGAPQDRRRDGSQESCDSTALHNLQQELGMARQAAQGGCCCVPAPVLLYTRFLLMLCLMTTAIQFCEPRVVE